MFVFVGFVGAEAENVVHFEDDGVGFAFVEFAFGVLKFIERSTGAGIGLTVFLEQHGFLAGAGEGIEEPGEGGRVATEFLVEATSQARDRGGPRRREGCRAGGWHD